MDGSVRQMLELSRLETGAKALRRTAFSLAELAQERLQAALPTDSTIHTEFTAQGEYEVNADRALLMRALDALLENAVQHTPESGCITVHLADGVLSVTNTGNAIPADALPRLWEAYYQADPSRSAKRRRTGTVHRENCVRSAWLHLRSGEYRNRTEVLVPICR